MAVQWKYLNVLGRLDRSLPTACNNTKVRAQVLGSYASMIPGTLRDDSGVVSGATAENHTEAGGV